MRSIVVAVYQLKADEIFIIPHHDCGMAAVNPDEVIGQNLTNHFISFYS